ncbi:uncharacterized protein BKCO1_36000122 [Diplodia corticola]|uniref:Uncharacterized protein n=1 Tax=Diplodia corticola TaxID=236234 RepID=A0A1J9QWD3_9PEZI|nr:uncharacterized protein BKCO1_36000122 [Diplodia corticola]OJD32697.1 hypothetical protein BKCO1_36000122 [Diplodia corticola]
MSPPQQPNRDPLDADLELLFRSQRPLDLELARQEAESQLEPLLHRLAALERQLHTLRAQKSHATASSLYQRARRRNLLSSIAIAQQHSALAALSRQSDALRDELARETAAHAAARQKYADLRAACPEREEVALLQAQLAHVEDQNEALRRAVPRRLGGDAPDGRSQWVCDAYRAIEGLLDDLEVMCGRACEGEAKRLAKGYQELLKVKLENGGAEWQIARLIESAHEEAERAGRGLPLAAVCAEVWLETVAAGREKRKARFEGVLNYEPSSLRFARRHHVRSSPFGGL